MTRTLTITAAEWASVQDGTLWLVREGMVCLLHQQFPLVEDPDCGCFVHPPAEFVQASCTCGACEDRLWDQGQNRKTDCLACRIELVGPCPTCEGAGWDWAAYADSGSEYDDPVSSWTCKSCFVQTATENGLALGHCNGTVTLGRAYAVGQPQRITSYPDCGLGEDDPHICWSADDGVILSLPEGEAFLWAADDEAAASGPLAHYGDPATLVGKWALQLAVTA